jgi:hypothetical protein
MIVAVLNFLLFVNNDVIDTLCNARREKKHILVLLLLILVEKKEIDDLLDESLEDIRSADNAFVVCWVLKVAYNYDC